MIKSIVALMLLLWQQGVFAQAITSGTDAAIPIHVTNSASGISTFINAHYSSDTARIRAIFIWVALHINYDTERFLAKYLGAQPVADVLKTRLAVCRGYADLFNELCSHCNIRSVVIGGYTKQNGVISKTAHAWVAAELDHKWWLFDPTWAAGYVSANKFIKSYSDTYYKLSPDVMLKDHMPFDPMYQFSDQRLTNKEFIEGRTTAGVEKPVFNFNDTLRQYTRLSQEDKTKSELRRILQNGIENDVIRDRVDYLSKLTTSYSSQNSFEEAMILYKRSIGLFNAYIAHKNNQFASIKVDEIKILVDSISIHADASYFKLGSAVASDEVNRQAIAKVYQELEKFHNRVKQEKEFVATYLNTDVASRKQLFYKK